MTMLIRGGRLLDPVSRTDRQADLRIEGGRIAEVGAPGSLAGQAGEVVDAEGRWILPGLVDLATDVCEPGYEYKETLETASAAAAAGGVTTIVTVPETDPVVDNAEVVRFLQERAAALGTCRVRVAAALEYSQSFGLTIGCVPDTPSLSRGACVHEGSISTQIGLRGVPGVAEAIGLARDLYLAEHTGGRLHVLVTTAEAVHLVRRAKERGIAVTAATTAAHVFLTHDAVATYNSDAKLWPPLREATDTQALMEGLRDGTLDALISGHRPQSSIEKDVAFDDAEFGATGLQTLLPQALRLWRDEGLPLLDVLTRIGSGAARVYGLPAGSLEPGQPADLTLVDPEATWELTRDTLLSKTKSSPWLGQRMQGRVELTLCDGRVTYRATDKD